jgi:hypothetical protein
MHATLYFYIPQLCPVFALVATLHTTSIHTTCGMYEASFYLLFLFLLLFTMHLLITVFNHRHLDRFFFTIVYMVCSLDVAALVNRSIFFSVLPRMYGVLA